MQADPLEPVPGQTWKPTTEGYHTREVVTASDHGVAFLDASGGEYWIWRADWSAWVAMAKPVLIGAKNVETVL